MKPVEMKSWPWDSLDEHKTHYTFICVPTRAPFKGRSSRTSVSKTCRRALADRVPTIVCSELGVKHKSNHSMFAYPFLLKNKTLQIILIHLVHHRSGRLVDANIPKLPSSRARSGTAWQFHWRRWGTCRNKEWNPGLSSLWLLWLLWLSLFQPCHSEMFGSKLFDTFCKKLRPWPLKPRKRCMQIWPDFLSLQHRNCIFLCFKRVLQSLQTNISQHLATSTWICLQGRVEGWRCPGPRPRFPPKYGRPIWSRFPGSFSVVLLMMVVFSGIWWCNHYILGGAWTTHLWKKWSGKCKKQPLKPASNRNDSRRKNVTFFT